MYLTKDLYTEYIKKKNTAQNAIIRKKQIKKGAKDFS